MPLLDRTGPRGEGPMTGRGMGYASSIAIGKKMAEPEEVKEEVKKEEPKTEEPKKEAKEEEKK